ncbi:MAG: hypothetical protein LC749_08175 [Actinobacteria bacterium]|nr:hypothetical protein [Actinomycetota bacterium]
MDDVAADAARAAAQALAGELGTRLPGDVETVLRARDDAPVDQYVVDPISLASLIVSVASFAWTAYRDLKTKTGDPARDVIERRVRVNVRDSELDAPPAQRDRIIEVVVTEIMGSTEPG